LSELFAVFEGGVIVLIATGGKLHQLAVI